MNNHVFMVNRTMEDQKWRPLSFWNKYVCSPDDRIKQKRFLLWCFCVCCQAVVTAMTLECYDLNMQRTLSRLQQHDILHSMLSLIPQFLTPVRSNYSLKPNMLKSHWGLGVDYSWCTFPNIFLTIVFQPLLKQQKALQIFKISLTYSIFWIRTF